MAFMKDREFCRLLQEAFDTPPSSVGVGEEPSSRRLANAPDVGFDDNLKLDASCWLSRPDQ